MQGLGGCNDKHYKLGKMGHVIYFASRLKIMMLLSTCEQNLVFVQKTVVN